MIYEIIYNIYNYEYDLLTSQEFEEKNYDFWEDWQSVADNIDLKQFLLACDHRHIPTDGTITPYDSGSDFYNFRYDC